MLIDKSERERDMMRFQSAIATQIYVMTHLPILLVKQEHLSYLFIDRM